MIHLDIYLLEQIAIALIIFSTGIVVGAFITAWYGALKERDEE